MNYLSDKTDLTVFIDGTAFGGITYISYEEKSGSKPLYEMLCETPWANLPTKKEYLLNLTVCRPNFMSFGSDFTVTLQSSDETLLFSGCNVLSVEESLDSSRRKQAKIKIIAAEKERIYD